MPEELHVFLKLRILDGKLKLREGESHSMFKRKDFDKPEFKLSVTKYVTLGKFFFFFFLTFLDLVPSLKKQGW